MNIFCIHSTPSVGVWVYIKFIDNFPFLILSGAALAKDCQMPLLNPLLSKDLSSFGHK